MPITQSALRNQILTSIFGRRMGLDRYDNLLGPKGVRLPVVAATSDTTGTNLPNSGNVSVVTTTVDGWVLDPPAAGCEVTISAGSSSTGTHSIAVAPAVIYSTNGIAGSTITMFGPGGYIRLMGLTTGVWQVLGRSSSGVCSVGS